MNDEKRVIMNSGGCIWFKFISNWELTDTESFNGWHESKENSANQ